MKIKLIITDDRQIYPHGQFSNPKTETYTIAEIDADLGPDATVGCLRALANSIEGAP